MISQGEVWWGETPDAKGRPYLILTRDEAIPVLRTVLVALRGRWTAAWRETERGAPRRGAP